MGLTQSSVDRALADPGPPPSPPAPSSSQLSPTKPFLSYFLPITTPDLTHTHHPLSTSDTAEMITILTSRRLPPELVSQILDAAEYWPVCRRLTRKLLTVEDSVKSLRDAPGAWRNGQEDELRAEREVEGSGLEDKKGEFWYLVSPPIGCDGRELRDEISANTMAVVEEEDDDMNVEDKGKNAWLVKVVLETLSMDQGWSDNHAALYGTYEQSNSWFELSLLRKGKEVPSSRHSVQNNVHAGQYAKPHRNTLGPDHPLVKAAQPGDRIVLWVRAKYQGWTNRVQ